MVSAAQALLDIRGLVTEITTMRGRIRAVDDVTLTVRPGEIVGIVGESGCGKSMTARSITRLLPPSARITAGEILYKGADIVTMGEGALRRIRGQEIAMIFQDPATYLNPVMKIGRQVAEAVERSQARSETRAAVEALLREVGLADAANIADRYPHELSGGMRQRVLIAIALACEPDLLIADEPTTALDVTIQAQILALLRRVQREREMAIMFISHDLGVIAQLCDRVYVMYAGEVVESGTVRRFFTDPKHPYARGLLDSVVSVDASDPQLRPIPGAVPNMLELPTGCRFRTRCEHAWDRCAEVNPKGVRTPEGDEVACWLFSPEATAAGGRSASR